MRHDTTPALTIAPTRARLLCRLAAQRTLFRGARRIASDTTISKTHANPPPHT
jgi:hypothetical protein